MSHYLVLRSSHHLLHRMAERHHFPFVSGRKMAWPIPVWIYSARPWFLMYLQGILLNLGKGLIHRRAGPWPAHCGDTQEQQACNVVPATVWSQWRANPSLHQPSTLQIFWLQLSSHSPKHLEGTRLVNAVLVPLLSWCLNLCPIWGTCSYSSSEGSRWIGGFPATPGYSAVVLRALKRSHMKQAGCLLNPYRWIHCWLLRFPSHEGLWKWDFWEFYFLFPRRHCLLSRDLKAVYNR